MLRESPTLALNTYPLASKMLLQGLVILDNKPDGLPPSPIKPTDPSTREFFPNSPPREVGSVDPSSDAKGLTDEELKFVPKPPDQSLTTRRNSLPRRNSTRRRYGSGQNDAEKEKHSEGVDDVKGQGLVRRGEINSERSRPHDLEESKDVRRSASLDARVPSVKSSKPPLLVRGEGSNESLRQRKASGCDVGSSQMASEGISSQQYSRGDGRYGTDAARRSMGARRGNDTVRTTSTSAVFHKRY